MTSSPGNTAPYDPRRVVAAAIGPYNDYCGGTVGAGAHGLGYITGLKLAVGITATALLDEGTSRITSGDRCRVAGAYLGQVNLLLATSYSGLDGAILGLDLLIDPLIANGRLTPLFMQAQPGGPDIPVLPIQPLLQSTRALLGTRDSRFSARTDRRFPPYPGLHLVAAYKSGAGFGPGWVWAVLAIAILEDRSAGANLFDEDGGMFGDAETSAAEVETTLQHKLRCVGHSIVSCGQNHGVRYSRIFLGAKALFVPSDYYGCAIACGPYLTLPTQSIPASWSPAALCDVETPEWERALGLGRLLPSAPIFLPQGESIPGGVKVVTIGCSGES